MADHLPYPQIPVARILSYLVAAVVAVILLVVTFSAWRSIHPGYVGIVFDKANHNVTTGALDPGWAFINPFTEAIQEYPITIQTYPMVQNNNEGRVEGDDSIKIQSNEGQQINLDVVIQYQVQKEKASQLYVDWGGAPIQAVEDGVVRQYTRSQVPVVASKYGWEDITSSKRGEIVQEITDVLTKEFDRRHLNLISFGVREVHLPQALQDALNQKIQAQQAAEQQKYLLAQAQVKADQDVAQATGEANAVKAKAQGDAQAILVKAQAQAQANELLAKSLTPPFIQYEQLVKWDGRLPLLTGGAATPLIDISRLTGGVKPAETPAPANQ
jgi:regulator of protease activity HflC (stomatin/prohibitin superfamily)